MATFTSTHSNSSLVGGGFSDGDLVIASGSQDKYIRLWKVADVTSASRVAVVSPGTVDANDNGKSKDASDTDASSAIDMLRALVGEDA